MTRQSIDLFVFQKYLMYAIDEHSFYIDNKKEPAQTQFLYQISNTNLINSNYYNLLSMLRQKQSKILFMILGTRFTQQYSDN